LKKARTLLIVFDNEISSFEIPAFRSAVAEKAGFEHDAFHNHDPKGGMIYRYPSIQYKRVRGKSAIFCIDEGVDALSAFFDRPSRSLSISGRTFDMKIHRMYLDEVIFQVWTQSFSYQLHRWIGLNPDNLTTYNQLKARGDESGIKSLLSRVLIGNMIAMAKGIHWDVDKKIELSVTEIVRVAKVSMKGVSLLGFDLNFTCNVFLPPNIGLGKSNSLGFGVVRPLSSQKIQTSIKSDYDDSNA